MSPVIEKSSDGFRRTGRRLGFNFDDAGRLAIRSQPQTDANKRKHEILRINLCAPAFTLWSDHFGAGTRSRMD